LIDEGGKFAGKFSGIILGNMKVRKLAGMTGMNRPLLLDC